MKYYAVIDTNVIVSSFIKPDSIPARIVRLALSDKITIFISDEIFNEYFEVLFRSKFNFSFEMINSFLEVIRKKAIKMQNVSDSALYFIDKSDEVFFEVTMASRDLFDTKLVTGNQRHFPDVDFVVSPREMLEYYLATENA